MKWLKVLSMSAISIILINVLCFFFVLIALVMLGTNETPTWFDAWGIVTFAPFVMATFIAMIYLVVKTVQTTISILRQ